MESPQPSKEELESLDVSSVTIPESIVALIEKSAREEDEESDIACFLYGMGLDCYVPLFLGMDIKSFFQLRENDLESVGIDISTHRKRFTKEMLRFFKHEWSNNLLKKNKAAEFTTIEAIRILRNIVKQIVVTSSSINFSNYYLETNEFSDLNKENQKQLNVELKNIKKYISQIKDRTIITKNLLKSFNDKNSELVLPTLIKKKNNIKSKLIAVTLITTIVGIYLIKMKKLKL